MSDWYNSFIAVYAGAYAACPVLCLVAYACSWMFMLDSISGLWVEADDDNAVYIHCELLSVVFRHFCWYFYDRKIGVMFLLFNVRCFILLCVLINVNLKFTTNIQTFKFVLVLWTLVCAFCMSLIWTCIA